MGPSAYLDSALFFSHPSVGSAVHREFGTGLVLSVVGTLVPALHRSAIAPTNVGEGALLALHLFSRARLLAQIGFFLSLGNC